MEVIGIKLRENECFKEGFSGFDEFKLLNVIIGKNNVGKSRLLDLVRRCCSDNFPLNQLTGASARCKFSAAEVNRLLGNELAGLRYTPDALREECEKIVINVIWDASTNPTVDLEMPDFFNKAVFTNRWTHIINAATNMISTRVNHPFHGAMFAHLYADRDIRAEKEHTETNVGSSGEWATDLIQSVLHTGSFNDSLIKINVLSGLREIFSNDGKFTSIQAKRITQKNVGETLWEVFLEEEGKGTIALSKSGSGLKTVILVLLYLHVCPKVVYRKHHEVVYAFEELENNLHPSLFRRLLLYVVEYARKHKTPIFITTHSSVALDVFGALEDAQIVHVKHDGNSASTSTVKAHFDRFNVVSELGAKPSDLLQANGLIWVEGPSDRVYINRWIEIFTDGKYTEGVHYQCVFYGGSLLANVKVAWDEEHKDRLVNLLKVNANLAIIMDSDKRNGGTDELKGRVARIVAEVELAQAFQWVTWGKEIENYLPGSALTKVFSKECRDPERKEVFFPPEGKRTGAPNYVEDVLGVKVFDKTGRALQIAPHLTLANMEPRGDWQQRIGELVAQIEKWNR